MVGGDADQFIDDLRVKRSANSPCTGYIPPQNGRNGTQPPKGTARRRLTRTQRYVILGVGALAMFCCGAVSNDSPDDDQNISQRVVTIYVTTQPTRLDDTVQSSTEQSKSIKQPASCVGAIEQAKALLKQASVIGSASDKVLDLISEANIAAQKRDTQGLNKASKGLRDLDFSIQHERADVMLPYQQIMDGLETCRLD